MGKLIFNWTTVTFVDFSEDINKTDASIFEGFSNQRIILSLCDSAIGGEEVAVA